MLPVPPTAVRVDKAKGYSLHIMSVANWVLPDAILRSWSLPVSRIHGETGESEDEDEELLVTLGVHVSLFHSLSKRFFGNTWVSSEIAVDPFQIKQDRHTKDNTIRHVVENVVLNLRAYFITDVVDVNCVGIVELVAYEKDPDSKATISVVGCGWTILPLFTSSQSAAAQSGGPSKEAPQQAFAIGASGESVNVFAGSPRVLWEIPSTQWHTQEKQERCKFYYQLVLYEPLLAIAMFIRKNEFVSALETIPGLKNGNLANIDVGKNPKMLLREDEDTTFEEALATFVKLASLVPKTILLEEDFTINVFATRAAIHLREEVEANLVARLKISRKTIHEGALSIEGEVSARVLKLALHNGRCFRTRLHTIPLKVEQQGSDHLRCVTNQTKLKGFVLHPHFAIVVILQFTVHFRITWPPKMKQQAIDAKKPLPPEEDVVLVTMGTRALVPSDGKKLYLYDKQHHATAEASDPLVMVDTAQVLRGHDSVFQDEEQKRRILHVELLSGAPCRPYSDNPLYTPPNQGGKPLQKQGLALSDSIAFVDLRIMIDGEGTLSPKRLPSPAKSLHRSNNNGFSGSSDDHDSDNQESSSKAHAAGHWATKMLNKADKNSILAQTLNALATSVSRNQATSPHRQAESNQQPTSPPASPSKKKQTRSATTDPVSLPTPVQASELSRASKTLLTRYGFMDAHDTSATNHQSPSSPSRNQLPNNIQGIRRTMHSVVKSLEVELSDVYKAHEIRFHFVAYRSVLSAMPSVPSRVYFTFQFYNFAPTRTETLRLSKAFDNGAGGESQTFLLMRESPVSKPSLAIQFDIDTTTTLDPLETRGFAEYLLRRNLYVDVWDAESLFQIGTFAIPLHELLRQGSGIKKFQAEVDIVQPIDSRDSTAEDDKLSCTDMESLSYSAGKSVVGKVQFLMSNYGLKGQHALSGPLVSAAPQVTAKPSSGDGANATHARVKHRVRARPLVDSNAELLRLLSQEGFYGADRGKLRRRREGEDDKLRRERQKQQKRGLSDATSLSPKEIAILCDLFGLKPATQSSSQHRSTRIQCDRDGKTGLLALLSVNPQFQNQQQNDAPRSVIDKPALELKAAVPDQQPPSALHVDRLKRVFSIVKAHEVGLQDAFELFDSDKDGFLSREEFMQALRSMGTVFADLSDDDLLAIVAAMDSNNDGKIEFKEFGAFLSSATQDPKVKSTAQWRDEVKRILVRAMEKGIPIHKIFAEFDASGDGNLSYDEFGRALQKLGVPQEQEKKNRESLMAEFDKNKDGQISYEEFLQSFGISVEINKVEIVKETVQDIEITVRETLKRMEAQGIELAQVFTHFDKNQNRKLSVSEFTQALQQLLQPNNATVDTSDSTATASSNSISIKALEQEAVHAFVKKINANGDDEIDYYEFLAVCGISGKSLQQQTQMHQDASRVQAEKKLIQLLVRALQAGMSIEQIFQQFDANADGKITISEFQRALDELFRGQGLTKEDTAMIASKFDADGDREVSFQEFQSFGHEIQRNQQALMGFFAPHAAKLAEVEKQSSKLALGKWQQLCSKDLKLTKQQMDAIKPLLPYFELVDETKKVDLTLLCSLLKPPATAVGSDPSSSTPAAKKEDPVTRLRAFLLKAKAMGVNVDSMFAEFDVDGDGEVTREEFKSILKKLGRFDDVSDQDLDAMLAEVDADGSGNISMREFKALIGEKSEERASSDALMKKFSELLTEAIQQGFDVEKCFKHFDKDSGGNITKSEFLVGMKQLGLGADDDNATLADVFAKLDRDGSGEISMVEFKQLFPGSIGSTSQAAEQPSSAKQDAKATPRQAARPKPLVRRASTSKSSVQPEKPIEDPVDPVDPPAAVISQKDRQKQPSTKDRLRALLQQAEQSGHDVGACFSHFDSDGDGKITAAEFVQGMKALAGFEDVTESELLALVGELDNDASNSVSLDEFKAFMKTDATVSSEEPLGKVEKPVDVDTTETVVVNDTKPAAEQSEGGQEAARADSESKVQEKPASDGPVEKQETEQSAGSSSVKQVENVETDESIIPSSGATEGTIITTEPEHKAAQSAAAVERNPPTPHSSSFATAKGKPPSFASRRANTDSAIGIDEKAPVAVAGAESQPDNSTATRKPGKAPVQRALSFAAARAAATRSNAVASSSSATPVTSPVLIGLDKLRTLLLSAAQQGVDIQVSFDHFDEDKNGQLTYDEFARGIRKLGSEFQQLTDEEIVGMAKELDQKQQSVINIQDLVQLVSEPSPVDGQAALSSIPDPSNAPATVQPTDAAVGKDPGSTDAVPATSVTDAVAVPKRALVSARVASDSTSHAPVRRTSSLKPAPSRLSSAAATKGGNATEVAAAQAPVMRTSSLKSAPKKIAPTGDTGNTAVVVPMTATSARTSEVMEKLSDRRKTPSAVPTQGETRSPEAAVSMTSDCAYAFHQDPQIRSVELKLRKAAVDAYSRGILPLRVITKFLDQDDGRPSLSSSRGSARARKKRDELLRVEFLQVLMELGFSLLSDQDEDTDFAVQGNEGAAILRGAPHPTTRMNDYLYARQLERLSRYKHHIKEETKAQKQLVRAVTKTKQAQQQQSRLAKNQQLVAEDSLRRFADEKNQLLRVLSYYRDGQKKSLVYSLIRDQVTTTVTLMPYFGALLFFELPFQNPYNHHERFRMEMVLPQGALEAVLLDINIVKSGAEWEFYRENLPLAYGSSSEDDGRAQQAVEKEMIDDHNEVVMDGHDRIQIPVRMRWLDANLKTHSRRLKTSNGQDEKAVVAVSMLIRSCTHGHIVALFKLQIHPQPLICHRVLRFSHPSGSIWRWRLRCPRGKYLVCMDPSVAVDGADSAVADDDRSGDRMVVFKCRVGEYPSLEEFYIVLYDDKYYAKIYEVWQVRIQAKLRLDIHAVMGQSVKNELIIRGDGSSSGGNGRGGGGDVKRHVKCFTTFEHMDHIQFRPSHVFQLVSNAFNRIEFAFCTTQQLQGSGGGCRVLVNLVDVETQELVGAWIVHVSLSLPLITKTYDLRLPLNQAAQKKIAYANPWDQQQTILLRSSSPALIKPRDAVLQIPGNGKVFLRLSFMPVEHKVREHMYLFINDRQTDQNEECLLFQVTYE